MLAPYLGMIIIWKEVLICRDTFFQGTLANFCKKLGCTRQSSIVSDLVECSYEFYKI